MHAYALRYKDAVDQCEILKGGPQELLAIACNSLEGNRDNLSVLPVPHPGEPNDDAGVLPIGGMKEDGGAFCACRIVPRGSIRCP